LKTRIKAFTIIELLVTMLVSSIVVSAGIYVFSTFNKAMIISNSKNLMDTEILQFQQVLKKDFIDADEIYFQYESIIINYHNDEKNYYDISDDYIVREAVNSIDTFNIQVYDSYINYTSKNTKLVNELVLETELDKLDYPIHVYKKYPAEKLIEQ